MRFLAVPFVASAFLAQEPPRQSAASAIVREAAAALDGDSVARVRARWTTRVRRNPGDRLTRLGLAQMDYLLGDFRPALSTARMVAGGHSDATAGAAWLIVALSEGAMAQAVRADSAFTRMLIVARAINDSSLLASGLALQALSTVRVAGGSRSDSLLEAARLWMPARDSLVLAGHLCATATVRVVRGQGRARPMADSGMAIARRHGDRRLAARCQLLVAQDLLRSGRVDSAARVFAEVADTQRAVHDRAGLTITLQVTGTIASARGEFAVAARAYREAAELGLGVDNAAALSSTALSGIALQYGRVDEARRYASRALALFRANGDATLAAATAGQLGNIARAAGDTRSARRYYEQALASGSGGVNSVTRFLVRTSLVDVSMMEGDWARAASELEASRRDMPDTPELRDVRATMELLIHLRRGRLNDAERILRSMTARPHASRAWFVGALTAELQARQGRLDSAAAQLSRTLDDNDEWRASLNDRQLRQTLLEPRIWYADPDLGVATVIARLASNGRVEQALLLAERQRARELLDRMARATVLGDRPRGREVPVATGSRSRSQWQAARPSIADLQARLPDEQTVLLEFVTGTGGEPTTLFAVTRSGTTSHQLASIDSVASQANLLTRLVTAGVSAPAVARSVGARLFDAALARLPAGTRRLVLVPDHGLHRLPFDVLRLRDGRMLGERFEVSVMPSATIARAIWARQPRGPGMLVSFGGPAFPSAETLKRHPATPATWATGLASLPFAEREARAVAARFEGSEVRTGSEASEARLKGTPMAEVSALHLATHAWVDEQAIGGSVLALAPGDGHDGLVLADDLASLDLDADVVTLSACATAGGVDVLGEGLVGLTAPLLEAGARAVVASGWRVGDAATARLMDDFYAELARGHSVGVSLERAKATARSRGAPISEWAAFTLVGDATVRPNLRPAR